MAASLLAKQTRYLSLKSCSAFHPFHRINASNAEPLWGHPDMTSTQNTSNLRTISTQNCKFLGQEVRENRVFYSLSPSNASHAIPAPEIDTTKYITYKRGRGQNFITLLDVIYGRSLLNIMPKERTIIIIIVSGSHPPPPPSGHARYSNNFGDPRS